MSGANLQHLLAMILYMAAVVGIGIYFAGRANKDAESYFLGGRSLGPWVTAFSAEASDMVCPVLRIGQVLRTRAGRASGLPSARTSTS